MKTFIFKAYINGEFFYKSACHYYVEKEAISLLKQRIADQLPGNEDVEVEIKKIYNEEHYKFVPGSIADLLVEKLTIRDGEILII